MCEWRYRLIPSSNVECFLIWLRFIELKKAVMTPSEECDRFLVAMLNDLVDKKSLPLCQRVKTGIKFP